MKLIVWELTASERIAWFNDDPVANSKYDHLLDIEYRSGIHLLSEHGVENLIFWFDFATVEEMAIFKLTYL